MDSVVRVDSRLPDVGVSIFAVMSRMAEQHGAINLSQGFPDFDPDPGLVDAVHAHMRAGRNQYAPMPGLPALRAALSWKYQACYGATYDPDTEVTVTAGATEALFAAITAFVHPGDEVILFEPAYDAYVPAIRLNGGIPRFVTLRPPDYRIDWAAFRALLTPRTRVVMLNSPHNPTGTLVSRADLDTLAGALDGSRVIVLSDEVYEHIVFDGKQHESLASHPALGPRSCVVGSFGKTYHTTGWKIGHLVAPAALTTEVRRVHQFVTFSVHTPTQAAFADLTHGRRSYADLAACYVRKRDRFLDLIAGSRFVPLPCHGTYFQILDYSAISTESDHAFALRLLTEHGVASIPTSAFLYNNEAPRVLRFCFAKQDATLENAAARLRAV